jgi:hypothetical protein
LGDLPGQATDEDDSFLWNQGNFYPESGVLNKLHGLWKFEDNHVFGSNLFVNGKYAWFGWGYGFAPRGGADKDGTVDIFNDAGARLLVHLHRAQALAHHRCQRQLVQVVGRRHARVQVRLRLPTQPQSFDNAVERLGSGRLHQRADRQVRAGLSRPGRQLRRREHQRVLRRHLQQGR